MKRICSIAIMFLASAGIAAASADEAVDDDNVDLAAVLGGNIRKAPAAATEEEIEPEPAHATGA